MPLLFAAEKSSYLQQTNSFYYIMNSIKRVFLSEENSHRLNISKIKMRHDVNAAVFSASHVGSADFTADYSDALH